ncbi:MAG TPA: extracellular solute-binding protein [Xanthobacteraceae bacterium]|jgi:multiple sugar transport system substrate-binding protein|nr:extracellular solute-binding protein [Xanthobacteraceae bacterium]
MARINRRRLLQVSGAGAVAAKTGGIAAILATSRAPAYAQGATVHWLRWNDFIPTSDEVLKKEIVPEAEKALGIKLNIEMINGNDLQARTTAAIQSGSGPDIILGLNNWPQLYAESVANVDDVVEAIGKAQGGFYNESKVVANDGKKWLGVPWCVLGAMIVYRKSWLAEQGANSFPATWEEYRAVGKKLKAAGRPIGQTLGHTFGDAPTFSYPYLWSWGGKEVEADGKTVALNSKQTVDSVKFMIDFWKEAHDEGGLAWDDTSNNRAFLAGTISATLNGASIYLLAKRKPETYLDEKGKPMFEDMAHSPLPKGPGGQFGYHLPMTNMVMGYSKNQKAAKDFLAWMTSKDIYQKWFNSQQGYSVGATTIWENDPLWNNDPVMLPFKAAARAGQFPGYAGPADRKAAEGLSKYLITDMYAKAVQGMSAEDAVKWADGEFKSIHAA